MGVIEEKEGDQKLEEGQEKDAVKEVEGEEEVEVVVEASQSLSQSQPQAETRVTRLQAQHPVTPIQVVPHGASPPTAVTAAAAFQQTRAPPQVALASLNSRNYTNRISLALFLIHIMVATAAVCFFVFKAVQGVLDVGSDTARKEKRVLKFWLPPIEGSAVLSMILAFTWQKAVRLWPRVIVHFVLWSTFGFTMAAGILLLCFSLPATAGLGVALIGFSIGTGLYACWVTRRAGFTSRVFHLALLPAAKFPGISRPAYLMLGIGFLWISLLCFAVIGALNFHFPPLTIIALLLSIAWTAEVMRNVANLTVSRVIALYYLRGMQSDI